MTGDMSGKKPSDLTKLAPQEMSRRLMGLPAKARLAAILSYPEAEALVAALPVEDFFFSVMEVGPDDAAALLTLGQVDQINHLFDLAWWDREDVQPAKALQWLERLASASEEKFLGWLYQADFELLVLLFKKWITVAVIPDDLDPVEAREQLPGHTLDDQFYWETRYVQFEDFISRLLNLIFDVHPGFYRELMQQVVWGMEAEIGDDAYRFHRARLEDRAIPDFYDAMEIYRALRPGETGYNKPMAVEDSIGSPSPAFAVAMLPENDLISRAFGEIGDSRLIDTLSLELASLANKVVVADRLNVEEPEALRFAAAKVAAYVNLGLDLLSHSSLKKAVEILREVFLEHLFRLAHMHVARLRGRLQLVMRQGWPSKWPTGIKCLDDHWLESAELLLQKTPRILRPAAGFAGAATEDFLKEGRDLFQTGRLVDVLSSLEPLWEDLAADPAELGGKCWQNGQIRRTEDITVGVLIWTAAANFLETGVWKAVPLPVAGWPNEFARLGPDAVKGAIVAWVERTLPEAKHRDLAMAYLDPLFREYAQEMEPFFPQQPPDPAMVKFFIFHGE